MLLLVVIPAFIFGIHISRSVHIHLSGLDEKKKRQSLQLKSYNAIFFASRHLYTYTLQHVCGKKKIRMQKRNEGRCAWGPNVMLKK